MKDTIENQTSTVLNLLKKVIPYKDRETKLSDSKYYDAGDDKKLFSWIINEWIPSQPDSDILMPLYIHLNFSAIAFIELVIRKDLTLTLKKLTKGSTAQ